MQQVLIHYDVPNHYVRLNTFVSSARAAEKSAKALSSIYFHGKIEFEVVILPPERGSLKQFIGIAYKGFGLSSVVLLALLQFMDSPSVHDISTELVGQKPSDLIVKKIRELKQRTENSASLDQEDIKTEIIELAEELVTRSVQGGLEVSRDELNSREIPEQLKFDLAEAQSEMYLNALDDPEVKGIGFSNEDDFPVPRNSFAERAIKPRKRETEEDEEISWKVETKQIRLTSPNFDREDQTQRKWKARDTAGLPVLFEVRDEEFWLRLKRGEFEFSTQTELQVQIAIKVIDGREKEKRVVRVLSVDDAQIAEPLTKAALKALVGLLEEPEEIETVKGLFE